ncbi:MAG TPA: hypothetical protein VJ746_14270 [Nitrospira sp.]|nr:hypothetical protein [Nitrospira sp.]
MRQVACPHCQSYKTVDQKRAYLIGGILLVLFSLPWVIFIFPIVFVLAGASLAVSSAFVKAERRFKCRGCGFQFPVPVV